MTRRIYSLALLLLLAIADAAGASARPNILFVAIDDLRNEIGAAGATNAITPALDKLAATGRYFSRHYAIVPTCGASRAALLRGRYPERPAHLGNNAIRDTHSEWTASLPGWFQRHGYRTLALGKITHYPGGLAGKGWAEPPEEFPKVWTRQWVPNSPWKTAEQMMHGYAQGVGRVPGKSPAIEAFDGSDNAYPDAWVADDAIQQLTELARSREPWLFAVGFFKPHLPFAAPKRYLDLHRHQEFAGAIGNVRSEDSFGKHGSGEFRNHYAHEGRDPDSDMKYAAELRRAYAAAISYVDAQVGRTLQALDELGLAENTIVVVWSDHGFLLGEHGVWGKHCLYEDALRSPLIIREPGAKQPGLPSRAIVESIDIFPTLVDLAGLPQPPNLQGRTLRPHLDDSAHTTLKSARGFWQNRQQTIRTDRWRLIRYPAKAREKETAFELFDHSLGADQYRNVAKLHPDVVRELVNQLRDQ